jgi:hypothetical protein
VSRGRSLEPVQNGGVHRDMAWQENRMLDQLEDERDNLGKQQVPPFHRCSRFLSEVAHAKVRAAILEDAKDVLDELAEKIDSGERGSAFYKHPPMRFEEPIGEGIFKVNNVSRQVADIHFAAFSFIRKEGKWFEVTGYPDIKAQLDEDRNEYP